MKRVLVVDDKEENCYYLQALLGARGFQVEVARNGAEALERARKSPPTAVVSDLLMPVMDGYTLLRHWKTDPVLQQSPFIVYTATYTQRCRGIASVQRNLDSKTGRKVHAAAAGKCLAGTGYRPTQ